MKYLLRMNCEYTLVVEADNEEQAIEKGHAIDMEDWEQAWSGIDCEEAKGEE